MVIFLLSLISFFFRSDRHHGSCLLHYNFNFDVSVSMKAFHTLLVDAVSHAHWHVQCSTALHLKVHVDFQCIRVYSVMIERSVACLFTGNIQISS